MKIAMIGIRGASASHERVKSARAEICPRLAHKGHEVHIITERNGHGIAPVNGASMIRLPNLGGGAAGHARLSSLFTSIRGYDIVNFCTAEASGHFSMAARLGFHRIVVSVHGEPPASPSPAFSSHQEMAAARYADAITVSSRKLERHFRDTYDRDTFYIPNGISRPTHAPDLDWFAPAGIVPGAFILTAGAMVPESGLHLAAAAAAAQDLPLVVIETGGGDGDQSYRDSLRAQLPSSALIMLGRMSPDHLEALLAHAYLIILPFQGRGEWQGEGYGNLLLQALARGRAVIVGDQAENMDIVGADAFTFTCGDLNDLRRVLTWLVNDDVVIRQMERRAAATAASRYCWNRIADAYELVFFSVL